MKKPLCLSLISFFLLNVTGLPQEHQDIKPLVQMEISKDTICHEASASPLMIFGTEVSWNTKRSPFSSQDKSQQHGVEDNQRSLRSRVGNDLSSSEKRDYRRTAEIVEETKDFLKQKQNLPSPSCDNEKIAFIDQAIEFLVNPLKAIAGRSSESRFSERESIQRSPSFSQLLAEVEAIIEFRESLDREAEKEKFFYQFQDEFEKQLRYNPAIIEGNNSSYDIAKLLLSLEKKEAFSQVSKKDLFEFQLRIAKEKKVHELEKDLQILKMSELFEEAISKIDQNEMQASNYNVGLEHVRSLPQYELIKENFIPDNLFEESFRNWWIERFLSHDSCYQNTKEPHGAVSEKSNPNNDDWHIVEIDTDEEKFK